MADSVNQSKFDKKQILPLGQKAGMEKVDLDHVNRVVYSLSKDSNFFHNEQKKIKKLDEKINKIKQETKFKKPVNINIPELISSFENLRAIDSLIIHVDMDMFYAAVAIRDNPSLKGKPVAVGSMAMIATASYEARKYGVRSGMPGFIAKKLCPELILVKSDFESYHNASDKMSVVFKKYDSDFDKLGLDECFLNLTSYCGCKSVPLAKKGSELAEAIRADIYAKTGLTASAGIACNRLLAKIATDQNKPNGQTLVPFARKGILDFLSALSVRKIPGVGKVTERIINDIGIRTCGEVLQNASKLFDYFSERTAFFLIKSCLGIGSTEKSFISENAQKSISTDRFFRPSKSQMELEEKCLEVCSILCEKFDKFGKEAKTITVRLKKVNFDVIARSKTLERFVFSLRDVSREAINILRAEMPLHLRAIGVKLSSLRSRHEQNMKNFYSAINTTESRALHVRDDMSIKSNKRKALFSKLTSVHGNSEKTSTKIDKKAKQSDFRCGKYFKKENGFVCPKCGVDFLGLLSLNSHLDICLFE